MTYVILFVISKFFAHLFYYCQYFRCRLFFRFIPTGMRIHNSIFPTPIGTPTDPHNLRKVFIELLEVAGLPEIRFHDLRHTSITLILNELGAPIKEAQKRAGHTNPSTTIGIYGGETASSLDVLIAQKLDELITPVEIELHQNCTEKDEKSHPQ